MNNSQATVIIPTHDHHLTLPLAVSSVLNQILQDFEILIVGDGVTQSVRDIANELSSLDERITFLDFPKGENHGEIYRHEAVIRATSENIFYLCDDDLLLPSHLSNLNGLLLDKDFVQSRNGFFDTNGVLQLLPADLSSRQCLDWHLKEPRRNAVSLTGTAHKKQTYLNLKIGWETTPKEEWPDHYMWKKFFELPSLKAATHSAMTTIQLPTSQGRETWSMEERYKELFAFQQEFFSINSINKIQNLVEFQTHRRLAVYAMDSFDRNLFISELEKKNIQLLEITSDLGMQLEAKRGKIVKTDRWKAWQIVSLIKKFRSLF